MTATPSKQPRRIVKMTAAFLAALAGLLPAAPLRAAESATPDRATAYYHYTLAHLYQQLAADLMRREYLNRAIEEYQAAIKADPKADYIQLKLVELYAKFNRLDDAVAEAQKMLAADPKNIEVRRLLGEFYGQYAFDRRGTVDQGMLTSAIQQYEQILDIDPKDEQALLQLAGLYRAAQNPAKAEAALKKALEIEPDSSEALTNLAFLYLDMGDADRAIEQLEKVRKAGQADQVALSGLARAYEQAEQPAKAAEIYKELVDEGGNTLPARRALAHNLLMAGSYDEALEQYKALTEEEPQNAENFLRLSQIYREQRHYDEAQQNLQKAAELAPDSSALALEIQFNTALLLESEGKGSQAIEAMQQLLKNTEKDNYSNAEKRTRAMFLEQLGLLNRSQDRIDAAVEAFHSMGELESSVRPRAQVQIIDAYRNNRDFDKALETSKAAVEEFPKDRTVVTMRATVLAETGNAEAGAELLRKLLDGNDDDDREVYLSLAQVYEKGRLFDKAVDAVEKAGKLANTKREKTAVLFSFGSVLERAKQHDKAEEKFQELLKIDPDNAAALNYLGYMLADLDKELDEAHDMVQKALDLDPDNGAYLDSLGWVYYRQQRFDLAERFLLRSLEQYKRDPVVHSHLAEVYYKLGKIAEAKEHWQLSIQEWERSSKADQDPEEIQKVREKLNLLETRMSSASAEPKKDAATKP